MNAKKQERVTKMETDYIRNHLTNMHGSTNYFDILEVYADDCLLIPEIEQYHGMSYFGIFSTPELLEQAITKIPKESQFQLLYLPDKKQIKELPKKFDLIVLRNLMLDDRETIRLLKICKSCLLPEGKILITLIGKESKVLKQVCEDILDLRYVIEGVFISIDEDITYLELRKY